MKTEREVIEEAISKSKGHDVICVKIDWSTVSKSEEALLWLEYIGYKRHNNLIKRMRES